MGWNRDISFQANASGAVRDIEQMRETALGQIGLFFYGRDPAEHGIR